MSLQAAILRVLGTPAPEDIWQLRAQLLESGVGLDPELSGLLREFYFFLDRLVTSTSSREYSELASKLDVSAIGGVVLERLVEEKEPRELALSLLAGALSEGLMVLATRQHVKAWDGELGAVFRETSWYLYESLWKWSSTAKPELPAHDRRQLIEKLLAPLSDPDLGTEPKAVIAGRLFQILLVGLLPSLNAH